MEQVNHQLALTIFLFIYEIQYLTGISFSCKREVSFGLMALNLIRNVKKWPLKL